MRFMKKIILKFKFVKIVLLPIAGTILFSGCQNISVNSQTKAEILLTAKSRNNRRNIIKTLSDFKWKNRIILIKENEDKALHQLKSEAEQIKERDIFWFRIYDGELETNFNGELPEDFAAHLENDYFGKFDSNVLLIGKDGTVKSKDDILNLKNYFGQIDSMPMRQREMKEN